MARKWRRLKVSTLADTDVLKTIVDREFLATRENILDLWIRNDNAFIKIRGYRGYDVQEAFKNRKVFQVVVPTKYFKERIKKYVRDILEWIPEPDGSTEPEENWYGSVLEVLKYGDCLSMRKCSFLLLDNENLKTLREWFEKCIAEIDEVLEMREGA